MIFSPGFYCIRDYCGIRLTDERWFLHQWNEQRRHGFYVENYRPVMISIEELITNVGDILGCRTLPVRITRVIYKRKLGVLVGKGLKS